MDPTNDPLTHTTTYVYDATGWGPGRGHVHLPPGPGGSAPEADEPIYREDERKPPEDDEKPPG